MANWWDQAPVVQPSGQPAQAARPSWESAPVVAPATPATPAAPAQPVMPSQPGGSAQAEQPRGLFRRVDDAVRGAADMLTFGFADEISAGLGSATGIGGEQGNYDGNLEAQRQRDAEGGWERFGGQIAGGFALPMRMAQGVGSAAVQGAGYGAAYGFGSGEGGVADRSQNAAIGGAVGGAAGAAVRGGLNALQTSAARSSIPTNDQLRSAATSAYNRAEAAGVVVKPEGARRLATDIVGDLADFGYDPALHPGVAAVLRRLEDAGNQNTTLKGLDVIRKVAGNAAKVRDNPSQQTIASRIIDRIDDYIDDLPAEDVIMGNARRGAEALQEARGLWGQLRRSEMVDSAVELAERRAASTGSGGNVENATRQNVRRLLDNPRTARGMSDTERQAAERVVRGTPTQNSMRLAGKLSPTSSGLMAALGVGGAMANPAVGAAALGGMAAKSAAERMTTKNVQRLSQIIRSGGRSADDLASLARGGQMQIAQVQRLEKLAKRMGVSTGELAAAARETVGQERQPLMIDVTPNR